MLRLFQSVFVFDTQRGSFIRQFLPLQFEPFVLFKMHGLLGFLFLEGDTIAGQLGLQGVNAFTPCDLLPLQMIKGGLNLGQTPSQERFLTGTVCQRRLGLPGFAFGSDPLEVRLMHPITQVLRAGRLQGRFG